MIMVREGYVLAALIAAITTLHACRDDFKKTPGKETVEKKNQENPGTIATVKDAQFVVDQVSANIEEIRLTELATTKGKNEELRQIAGSLKAEHQQLLEELQDYAEKKEVSIPPSATEAGTKTVKRLDDKKATEFDKDWCESLMTKHRLSIDQMESAAANISDAELKQWVAKAIPKLRTHHDKLMACHHKLN